MSGGYPRVEKMTHRKVQNGSVQNAQNLTLILGQVVSGPHFLGTKTPKPPHLLYFNNFQVSENSDPIVNVHWKYEAQNPCHKNRKKIGD